MGLMCDESAGDKMIAGTNGCSAVLHKDALHIEIWCEDYERHYGNVPADFTAEQINVVVHFYHVGESRGREFGAKQKQHEIRSVLGIH